MCCRTEGVDNRDARDGRWTMIHMMHVPIMSLCECHIYFSHQLIFVIFTFSFCKMVPHSMIRHSEWSLRFFTSLIGSYNDAFLHQIISWSICYNFFCSYRHIRIGLSLKKKKTWFTFYLVRMIIGDPWHCLRRWAYSITFFM